MGRSFSPPFWVGGVGEGERGPPGPGAWDEVDIWVNQLLVRVSERNHRDVCEFFHVAVCACWLNPLEKQQELSPSVLFSTVTCFQKQLGRKLGLGLHSSDGWMVRVLVWASGADRVPTWPWLAVTSHRCCVTGKGGPRNRMLTSLLPTALEQMLLFLNLSNQKFHC